MPVNERAFNERAFNERAFNVRVVDIFTVRRDGHDDVVDRISGALELEGLERVHYFVVKVPWVPSTYRPLRKITKAQIAKWVNIPDLDAIKAEMLAELDDRNTDLSGS